MGFEQALGGFLQGGVEGYRTGIKMQQEEAKQKREEEAHKSALETAAQQRKATGLQIEQSQIALKRSKDEEAMRADIAKNVQLLAQQSQGGVSGTVMDNQGNAVGEKQFFGNDQQVQEQMRQAGVEFVPGSMKKIGPMDEFTKHRAFTDIMTKARFDHGLMDENALKAVFENNKALKNEGIEEGTRHFLATGDSDGAMQIFDKSGAIKSTKGMFLRRITDDKTGITDVGVYKPGKDGHPELVTTMNQYLTTTTSAGLQNYMAARLQERKLEVEKGIAAGHDATTRDVHAMDASTRLAIANNKGSKSEQADALIKEYIIDPAKAVASNSGNAYDPDAFLRNVANEAAYAKKLMLEGMEVTEAVARAKEKYKDHTPSAALKQPKK